MRYSSKSKSKKFYMLMLGAVTGIANGLFGSGGGMIGVPMLEKYGMDTKKSHATCIAITLPFSIVSSFVYFNKGNIDLSYALKFIPLEIVGVIIGGILMKKLSSKILKKAFGLAMIYFGLRLMF